MISRRIANATHRLGPPKGWDREKDGDCGHLLVRKVDNVYESAWEPTPAELAAINDGASIVLRVHGGQPPVMLYVDGVTPPAEATNISDDVILEMLNAAYAINIIGTSDHPSGYGPPYKAPWFIVDTRTAEPEVNHPGELIKEISDPADLCAELVRARIDAARAAFLEKTRSQPVSR